MKQPKVRIVLASHGEQSKGMLNTVQMLLGPQENIAAYSLLPEQPITSLTEKLEEEIKTYGPGNIVFMTELMFDGSTLPFEDNIRITKQVVALAKSYGANVEAELGSMGAPLWRAKRVQMAFTDRLT